MLILTMLRIRFYYVDQRLDTGVPPGRDVDGPAHAEYFQHLVETPGQGPVQSTFVAGKGYKKFEGFSL
jgi:hypothetical protein